MSILACNTTDTIAYHSGLASNLIRDVLQLKGLSEKSRKALEAAQCNCDYSKKLADELNTHFSEKLEKAFEEL